MRDLQKLAQYAARRKRSRRFRGVLTAIAAVVVFCTTYALILPAITLEGQSVYCGFEDHTHTEDCYQLACGKEEFIPHYHGAECRDENGDLICHQEETTIHVHSDQCKVALTCTQPEREAHQHSESCYESKSVLVCGSEEASGHTHGEGCYQSVNVCGLEETPGHAHGEGCYAEDGSLSCTQEEAAGHSHSEGCFTSGLVCTLEETPGHSHTESCYQAQSVLVCQKEEGEGHTHTDSCYGTFEDFRCGHPEGKEVHEHTSDCYRLACNAHIHEEACYTKPPEEYPEEILYCGKEAHIHGETCYDEAGNLICTLEEHSHDAACTVEAPKEILYCGKEAHIHGETCYDQAGNLICTLEEHSHDEACTVEAPKEILYCGKEAHIHGETCYDQAGNLICTLEEHSHDEACTVEAPKEILYCGKEAHIHGETCYDEAGNLICTLEEHSHSLACSSDPAADVETAEIWEQTFAGVTLTGNWRQDAVSIAQTQLGYTESTKNYMVAEDGETVKGYTRYGAWYGEPYADWNTMFLSFCLHYAGVEDVPMDANCGIWATAWADAFVPAQAHEAAAGDLVFFDRDGDGTADHAGLVTEVTDSGFAAIEGDAEGAVRLLSYGADDSTILGYVNLPKQAEEFTLTAQTETGIIVTITGESASLPYPVGEITVTVVEVVDEESQAIRDQLLEEETVEAEQRFLLDITLWHDGEEIEPTGPVTVTFSGIDTEGLYPKVYHIDTEANEVTDMDAVKGEAGDITVSTDHFSLYDVQLMSAPEGTGISGESITQIADGGEYYLTGTANTSNTITITKDTVLDLNGYGVYYQGTGDFLVVNGGTLTIKDSRPASVSESNGSGNLYGNVASLESNGNKPVKLTYYVTQSSANGTGTSETLKKYEVAPTGCIVGEAGGGAASIVKVNSGATCNLEGGLLTIKNSSSYNGDAHIISNRGTLNLRGGYVAGGKDTCWGGGIFSENGTVNMSGGVIADNYGTNGGGLCVKGGSFTMTGGVISGNGTHSNNVSTGSWDKGLGGGIFAENATVRIEGGYITNNSEYGKCEQNGFGCHGGGGIATTGGSLTMTGGYVTGNYSEEAGGGMYVGHYNLGGTNFSMSGGIVARNVAQQSEGGGIRISGHTNGTIRASGKVYITNNRTNSTFDWGGGGIFVQADGNLTVINGLITNNSAGGYGGGVAACPTGKTLIVHMEGAAIYGNSDEGKNMSGGGNGKDADTNVAKSNSTFTSNGHKDYFCVRYKENSNDPISLVTGEMPGGGAANWTGSSDGTPITISKTGYATANYLFGLAANPDQDAINKAQNVAGIIISGNHSYVHGGGIMTNGGLIIGNPTGGVVTATPALDISGTKALLKDNVPQPDGLDFQFRLKDGDDNEVGTATANATTGKFTISPNTTYSQAGTYTYTLSEVNDSRTGVTYDASEYTIQVTIAKKDVTLLGVTFTSYYVNSVNINKSGGADTTEPTQPDPQPDPQPDKHEGTFRVHFKKPDNWEKVYMYIWDGNDLPNSASWPGDQVDPDPAHPGWYTKEFTVSRSNNFKYKFSYYNNNQTVNQTNDLSGSYSPGGDLWAYADGSSTTTAPDDWNGGSSGSSGGSNVSFTGTKNSDGSYSLTINGDAFTNTITSTTQLNLQILKTDSNDADKVLKGATFSLKKPGEATGKEATTGENGIATFEGIGRNTTYYLYETKPPANYMTGGPWILEVADRTATLYSAAEGGNGTLTKTSDTGTELDVIGNNPIVLTATIADQPWGYELPQTGGAGTVPYTMGGLLLITGAAFLLLYSNTKRRKEDSPSS